jgi:hypothetical protein
MRTIIGLLLLALTAACAGNDSTAKKEPETFSISKEDKALLDKLKAKEQEKADLLAKPAKYIKGDKWDKMDSGIINTYSKAVAVEFTNTSQFDVSDIEGKITYSNDKGEEMATVPFKAEGDVRAGETKKLKVTAQEITGAAKTGKVVVEKVRVLGG